MTRLGIIGGTGLNSLRGLDIGRREVADTPYGESSAPLIHGTLCGIEVVFLARHGKAQNIPPHKVNYRANIWAIKQSGVEKLLAVAAVGGIHPDLIPGRLAVPDQLIDYTWSRAHTFCEDELARVVHIDFTQPYCQELRVLLLRAAREARLDVWGRGTYGATQGPRLETAAEINRLERDGCDMVGMTGMPEAVLARELGLCYATCAVVANVAAGRAEGEIDMAAIETNLKLGMNKVYCLLKHTISLL